jgi:two-component system sensor histidine kinase RegB
VPAAPTQSTGSLPLGAAEGLAGARDLSLQFAWLLRLRWAVIAGQAALILLVHHVLHVRLPLTELFAIVGVELLTNAGCTRWLRTAPAVGEWMLGTLMAFDVLLLTLLLYLTGGVFNPFSFLYLVHIALAAVVLRDRWTWMLVGASFLCLGLLFLDNMLQPGSWLAHPEDHAHHIELHLQGMWVAFGIAAAFIVYFVTRVTRDLAGREAELARARLAAQRSEKLASLATLAAGAAHELATPLSTIAVVAKELERMLEGSAVVASAAADARLIRGEVQRCREILAQMAEQAGESTGEGFARVGLAELLDAIVAGLPDGERARVATRVEPSAAQLDAPAATLARALRGLVKNALQASAPDAQVELRVRDHGGDCELVVADRGAGMPSEVLARAGEPFFTTKEPGKGMGLGLFLARAVVEHLGGTLRVASNPGRGTEVTVRLPC